MTSPADREKLVGRAYADSGPLEARQAIYRWQEPAVDLPAMAVAWLRDVAGLIIDVGCGNSRYLQRIAAERPDLSVLGLDLSPGMRPHAVADAERLPVADASAGAVLAMHMLYHVPDIDRAIGEMARVLRPDGTALAATNGDGHMREFDVLFADAVRVLRPGAVVAARPAFAYRFRLENGVPLLGRHFESVQPASWETAIRIPEPGPVIGYLDSTRASREGRLPAGVTWAAMLAAAEDLVTRVVDREGEFAVTGRSGIFICRSPRR
jgi:ubiquinone/menaquinone biosynthesis C-methylase UbiE